MNRKRYRVCAVLPALMIALCAATTASAQLVLDPPRPRFWTWHMNPTSITPPSWIVPMIVPDVAFKTAEQVADFVWNEVRTRNLQWDNICVLMQNFGVGAHPPYDTLNPIATIALMGREDDGIMDPRLCDCAPGLCIPPCDSNYSSLYGMRNRVPWADNGIADASVWISTFINRYKNPPTATPPAPQIPTPTTSQFPSRFYFDTELARHFWLFGDEPSKTFYTTFVTADDRYLNSPVPGFGNNTLAELEALEFPSGGIAANQDLGKQGNFFQALFVGAEDGMMSQAAYPYLRVGFQHNGVNAKTSNYERHTHGLGSVSWPTGGDYQSPSLYSAVADMDGSRSKMDAYISALPGPNGETHEAEMVPWVWMPLSHAPEYGGLPGGYTFTAMDTRNILAMVRRYESPEVIVFNPESGSSQLVVDQWNALDLIIREVWSNTLADVTLLRGSFSGTGAPAEILRNALPEIPGVRGSLLTVTGTGMTTNDVSFELRFDTALNVSFSNLAIALAADCQVLDPELEGTVDFTLTVEIKNINKDRYDVATGPMTEYANGSQYPLAWKGSPFTWRCIPDATDYVDTDGSVYVRVTCATSDPIAFKLLVDYVQLIEVSDPLTFSADVNQDGIVNSTDATLLNPYLPTTPTTPATRHFDVNGDGNINYADVSYIYDRLGQVGPQCH